MQLAAILNSIIKFMFHGNQLRRVSFPNTVKLTGKYNYKSIVRCRFPNKAESALRHEDWEIEELKIRTAIHKLAMITFYVLVSAGLSEK